MKATLKKPKYRGMKLVKIAYGNDNDTKSAQETQALLQAYPNLKGIIAPTSVGLPAAARVLQQAGKCGSVALTGLTTPNSMRAYTKRGCGKKFGLWNEVDFGYLAVYVANAVIEGKLTGKPGESILAGRLGKRTVGAGGTMPMGPPLVFTRAEHRQVPLLGARSWGRARCPAPPGGLDERDRWRQAALVRARRVPAVRRGITGRSSHESACLLNAGDAATLVRFTFFFADRDPLGPVELELRRPAYMAHPPRRSGRARRARAAARRAVCLHGRERRAGRAAAFAPRHRARPVHPLHVDRLRRVARSFCEEVRGCYVVNGL